MGRPRKGVQFQDGRYTASLPVAVGSKKTKQFTDADETAVRRWYADGERALAAGHPLPDPAGYRTGRPAPELAALALGERTPASWWAGLTAAYGHRIDRVSEAFVVHRYDRQRSGQPERRGAVVATITNDLLPFFAWNRVTVMERITHELVGKLAAHLAAALRELSPAGSALRLALAAPTGRAAARLQEALRSSADDERVGFTGEERAWLRGLEASTLHRLLGARPGSSWLRYDRDSPLPVDVLVVDEASMVSLTSVARLLAALPPAARLVLVGDPDQLASVEAGAVLADLTAAGSGGARTRALLDRLRLATPADVPEDAPVVEPSPSARVGDGIAVLRRVHRFGGAIAELAQAIRDGDGDAALSVLRGGDEAVRFAGVDDDGPLTGRVLADLRADTLSAAGAVLAAARAGDGPGALTALERYRLMCAHRRGPRGVANWQRTVEAWVADELGVRPNRAGRYPGLPLLVRSNDPDNHLSNGDTGVVLEEESGLVAVFGQPDAMLRVPLGRLDDVVPLRALTVHRSQGGQFDRVAVLLPSPASSLATRETIYTAVTRAKEAVTVVGSEAAVRRSVERPATRATGLGRRLTAPGPTSSGTR